MIAYAAPPMQAWACRPSSRSRAHSNITYPGASRACSVRATVAGALSVPPCHAKDAAGSCPNCFSHDNPNDPAPAPGPGPNAWWDNSSCRNPDFHLPDFGGDTSISIPQLTNRYDLLRQLEEMRRGRRIAPRSTKR